MTPEEAIERLAAAKNNLERAGIVTALIAAVMKEIVQATITIEPEGYALVGENGRLIACATTIDAIMQAAKERGLTAVRLDLFPHGPPGLPDPPRPEPDREWA